MKTHRFIATALLATALPLAAQATEPYRADSGADIRRELADARQEVRAEIAKARAELDSENLPVGNSLHFGKGGKRKLGHQDSLPDAQITPKGDLLIAGKAVAINAQQRQQLLAYRGQVIDLAKLGIDGGEQAAMAALEATNVSLFSLIVGGLTGSLEHRVEATVKQHVLPLVRTICQRLPKVLESQQQLANSLPQFRPYATLERDDVDDCEQDIRNNFAMH